MNVAPPHCLIVIDSLTSPLLARYRRVVALAPIKKRAERRQFDQIHVFS